MNSAQTVQLRYQIKKGLACFARAYLIARAEGDFALAKEIKNCISKMKVQLNILSLLDKSKK